MFCWGLDPPTGLSNEVPAVGGRYPPIERSSRRWGAVPPYRTKFPPLGGGTPAPPPPHPQKRHFKKFKNRLVLDCDWEVWDICDGDCVVAFGGD